MTALSIPERAREIVERIIRSTTQRVNGFNMDYGSSAVDGFIADQAKEIEAALHSERELCAKELEEVVRKHPLQDKFFSTAKLLREGGQKC